MASRLVAAAIALSLAAAGGGCSTYAITLKLQEPRDKLNAGQTVVVDVVRAIGEDDIAKLEQITPRRWFVDPVERDKYEKITTTFNAEWLDSVGRTRMKQVSPPKDFEGKSREEADQGRWVYDLEGLKGDVPVKIFIFANYATSSAAEAPVTAAPLVFDPREEPDFTAVLDSARLRNR